MNRTLQKINFGKMLVLPFLLVMLNLVAYNVSSQVITYTFTPAGATGRFGPSQAQLNTAYLATNLNGSVTSLTGIQQFTIPSAGIYRIEARGAQGAAAGAAAGGLGARMIGDFTFTVGTVLKIVVGQQGLGSSFGAGGGGGGSYIATITNSPLVVAGGGSGAGDTGFPGSAAGTGSVGNAGGACANAGATGFGGGDATACGQGAGGAGGFYGDGASGSSWGSQRGYGFVNGSNGGLSSAGARDGGFGGGAGTHENNTGGGAGGGYTGGGAANHGGQWVGGAGSSFNLGTNQTNTAAFNSGQGQVLITRLCNINITALGLNASGAICSGGSATLTTDAISNYTWSTGSNAASIVVAPGVTTSYTLTAMSPSNCITSAIYNLVVSSVAPNVSVTASSNSVCLSNTVTLLASGGITYTWSPSIPNGIPFTPPAGINVYSVVAQNGCGTNSTVVTVSVSSLPVIGITSPTLVCAGNTATLSGGGATTYTWMPGNAVGASVIVSPAASTIYTVTGMTGPCAGTFTVPLATNPNPTLSVSTSSLIVCAGTSVTLTATGANSYTWQSGGVVSPTLVVAPTTPTLYYVTGSNSFNCSVTISQAVIVNASPSVSVAASSTNICIGSSAILSASGANAYSWSNGPSVSSQTVSPATTTSYTVVGTNTTTQCTDTKTIQVSVFAATIAVSSPTAVCIGSSVTLIASGANTYNWSNGSTGSSILVSPVSATGYTVSGVSTIGSGTCASSGTTSVAVNPLPVIVASSARTFICRNEKAIINASGGATYAWSNLSTGPTITVTPLVSTPYTVTGTDANGCKSIGTITINVSACVGVEDLSSNATVLSLYPNPSQGEFHLKADQDMVLTLVNELGQSLRVIKLNASNSYYANISDLPNGVYFVTGSAENYKVNQKIIIQK